MLIVTRGFVEASNHTVSRASASFFWTAYGIVSVSCCISTTVSMSRVRSSVRDTATRATPVACPPEALTVATPLPTPWMTPVVALIVATEVGPMDQMSGPGLARWPSLL